MINKPNLSSIVRSQLPEYVREDYQTFVAFVQAYYEYLKEVEGEDLETLRSVESTIDSFIQYFKKELSSHLPNILSDERFILQRIKDLYLAKGTKSSFDLMFRLLFNKEVVIKYPGAQILKASDGKWQQDISLFIKLKTGTPEDIVGKTINIITSNGNLKTFVDHYQSVNVLHNSEVIESPDIFQFFITKKILDYLAIDDRVVYSDVMEGNVYPTTSKVTITSAGKNFKAGELYQLNHGNGIGSILKIVKTDLEGSIAGAAIIKFGTNYTEDFSSELISTKDARDVLVGNIDEVPNSNKALVSIKIGPAARYPGYYSTNDGFLDDAVFIQDGFFYQAYSYEITIDEQLKAYKSALISMVHPAGMALFGNYEIYNEIDLSAILQTAGQIINLLFEDEFTTEQILTKDIHKPLLTTPVVTEQCSLEINKYLSTETVSMVDAGGYIYFGDLYCEPFYFANDDGNYTEGTFVVF